MVCGVVKATPLLVVFVPKKKENLMNAYVHVHLEKKGGFLWEDEMCALLRTHGHILEKREKKREKTMNKPLKISIKKRPP